MPDDEKPDETQPTEQPTEQPAAAPEPPPYVTKDELRAFSDNLTSRLSGMIDALNASRQPAPAAAPAPTIDLRELDDLIAKGEAGAAERLAALIDQRVGAAVTTFGATDVAPLRNYGLGALEQLAKRTALGDKPHAKRFEREIDEHIKTLGPEIRCQPAAWENAYALVIGHHYDDLAKEDKERVLRESGTTGAPPPTTSAPVTLPDGRRVPSIEEFIGPDAMEVLRAKGVKNADEFAERLGYDSWADYMRTTSQLDAAVDDEYLTPKQRLNRGRSHARH